MMLMIPPPSLPPSLPPAGLRDLCLECMQYQAEDRIDDHQLNDWLKELLEVAKEQQQQQQEQEEDDQRPQHQQQPPP
jgi:hypothetical protein